jgi:hypothetical protein
MGAAEVQRMVWCGVVWCRCSTCVLRGGSVLAGGAPAREVLHQECGMAPLVEGCGTGGWHWWLQDQN